MKGGLRGDLPPQNPFPLASSASNFFSLYIAPSPEASGKSLYIWPGLASLALSSLLPCFKFFLPLQSPLSGGLGQVFVHVAEAPPNLPPCFTFFSPLHRPPLSEASGKSHSEASPATYAKTCPAYATPFVPTLPKTPSPERLLRPALPSSPASNSFSLYTAPCQEASGKSLYMWPGAPP